MNTGTTMTCSIPSLIAKPSGLTRVSFVTLRGWSGQDRVYDLGCASALIRGPNGAGKTALIDALRFACEGVGRRGRKPEDAWRHARTDATELSVTVELAGGLKWTRGIRREVGADGTDRLQGWIELAGRERLKVKAAEEALRAEIGSMAAQWDLAGGYHGLSPQAKRTFLLGLLGGAKADDMTGRLAVATWARLRGFDAVQEVAAMLGYSMCDLGDQQRVNVAMAVARAAEPEQSAAVQTILTELWRAACGTDASADLLAMGESAKAAVQSRQAVAREAQAAARALQDQAVEVAVAAGTGSQAEADLASARESRLSAERALVAGRERAEAHGRAVRAEQDARAALRVLEEEAAAAEMAAEPGRVDAAKAELAAALQRLSVAVLHADETRSQALGLEGSERVTRERAAALESEAHRSGLEAASKASMHVAAVQQERLLGRSLAQAQEKMAGLATHPAVEALACWQMLQIGLPAVKAPTQALARAWDRLGEILRALSQPEELQSQRARLDELEAGHAAAVRAVEETQGQADIWSDTAADRHVAARQAREDATKAAVLLDRARGDAGLAEQARDEEKRAVQAAEEALRAALAEAAPDLFAARLTAAAARLAEATAALDCCVVPAARIEDLTAAVERVRSAELAAADQARKHQEAGARVRTLADALSRARRSELEHGVAVAAQRALQDVRETWMARVVAPLVDAMGAIVRFAWPAAPGCTPAEVYAELETLHGNAAAELGVRVEGAGGTTWRVAYETMSGAQAAVFDAALVASLLARGPSRVAVLALELDALAGPTASRLLVALDEHALHVQVLAATWQEIAAPKGWGEVQP